MPLSKIVSNSITDNTITTDQIADTSVHGRRNLVINGGMQISQRATSTTGSNSNNVFPACDRWKVGFTSSGTYDFSQSTDTPDGFSNSIKVKCALSDTSIASGDEFVVQHRIEAQDLQQLAYGTSAAENITLSFYAKAVNKTGTYCVHIQKNDSTAAYIYKEYTLTTSWQRFELTFPANAVVQASGGAIANDNGIGLIIMFILMNGSSTQGTDAKDQWSTTNHRSSSSQVNFMDSTSNEWYITGVQLELGSNASPFEHRSFNEELILCQRYYQKFPKQCVFVGTHSSGGAWQFPVKTEFRAQPTIVNNDTSPYWENSPWISAVTSLSGFNVNISTGHCDQTGGDVQFTGTWNPTIVTNKLQLVRTQAVAAHAEL